ncbi:MAG: hypothetical protein DRI44_05425 [Chlamydiae bacterium]|nr:MAG: hypothetical protein DRI44_05425 [Chlamydiota bacterium]
MKKFICALCDRFVEADSKCDKKVTDFVSDFGPDIDEYDDSDNVCVISRCKHCEVNPSDFVSSEPAKPSDDEVIKKAKRTVLETVLPCVPGCDICSQGPANAWGVGGAPLPHARERFVRVAFVEIEEKGKRKLAIKLNQPPNCEGRHKELLLFPLDEGLDSDEQEERDIRIIRELR